MSKKRISPYHFLPTDKVAVCKQLGKTKLLEALRRMLLVRNFEIRAESAYQQGKIGGFFHSSIGQEAIHIAAVLAFGEKSWYTTTYRCHSLALILKEAPDEFMAELFGKASGNAKGRGGSMHFFLDNLLGGYGIVGGHLPIAAGAAFSSKYRNEKDRFSLCFLGEGAVAQGSFHETLNLSSLWSLPCVFIIENNHWGMGTSVDKAICVQPIADHFAPAYGINGYTVDGMDFLSCYDAFSKIHEDILKNQRPILVEMITSRFKGHSISDPALYRTKQELEKEKERDPIYLFKEHLIAKKWLTEEEFTQMDKIEKERVKKSLEYAEKEAFPDPAELEEDVFAREDQW